ncbi:MAG: DUF1684 domain-containing protein [Lutibacter sp.]|nr:DUF1684 domain-containing protein [Lutibacter sp.]
MKQLIFSLIIILSLCNCTTKKASYDDEIKLFQYALNIQFADAEETPLKEEDLKTFKSLDFFKIDENYKVIANLELTPDAPIFEMKTTTERIPLYKKYGIAHFTINGQKLALSIYKEQKIGMSFANYETLFIPFNDTSNGITTYGGGRYIDMEAPSKDSKTIVIDFNKAYNPYCVYNDKYSCPIPPSENNLSIAISAGVKAYSEHH